MLAKYWKKIGALILIIACVFNVMNKLVHKLSLNKEMLYSAIYMQNDSKSNTTNTNKSVNNNQSNATNTNKSTK